jgi:hypothetical protein
MPEQITQFDIDSAKRIAEATRYVESMMKNPQLNPGVAPRPSEQGFWAKITDRNDSNGNYGWTAMGATDDDSPYALQEETDWPQGTTEENYAVEANDSKVVLKGSYVWMVPAKSNDYYIFYYSPGIKVASIEGTSISSTSSGNVTTESIGDDSPDPDTIEAYNFSSQTLKSEDGKVLITYSETDARWIITAQDCNAGTY